MYKKEQVYDLATYKYIDPPKKMVNFLNEIQEICKKYNLSISHEDSQGAFIIERYFENNIEWLKDAQWAGDVN